MNPSIHVLLERLQSLVAEIDRKMLASKQRFVPEGELEKVRQALANFLDCMPKG